MAVHWIDLARSIAMRKPPPMDMCAPRRTGWIGDSPSRRTCEGSVSPFETARAGVFKKLIHRREQYAGAFHVQSQIEIQFVVEKMNIAVTKHAEERARGFEITCVNDAVLDLEIRGSIACDAVAASRHDFVQNS
jgi:hypothetical protein